MEKHFKLASITSTDVIESVSQLIISEIPAYLLFMILVMGFLSSQEHNHFYFVLYRLLVCHHILMDPHVRESRVHSGSILTTIIGASNRDFSFKNKIEHRIDRINLEKLAKYQTVRRSDKSKVLSYRKGPAPIEEVRNLKAEKRRATPGTLDSDLEGVNFEDDKTKKPTKRRGRIRRRSFTVSDIEDRATAIASSKALITYFAKLGKSVDVYDEIDLKFLVALLETKADINACDKHGQTIFHEVAREWHTDIARFLIENGADVNKTDKYGRTPLHVAASVNYSKMIELLIRNGGEY